MQVTDASFATAAPPSLSEVKNQKLGQRSGSDDSTPTSTDHGPVAICIPTYKRPGNLAALLKTLRNMDRAGIDVHIIVVDNDENQSALPVVENIMEGLSLPFTYDCVTERNLPMVRNRLVSLAKGIGADWMWFLDDDQFVEIDALRLMLTAAEKYEADDVVPRVRYDFGDSKSSWARWSGIFDELHRPTGKPTKRFGTNGPLCRVTSVCSFEQPFDPMLKFVGGHHGGEDGQFFARFHALGFRSIGCDEAVIHDRVHSSRNNPHWLTLRALRIGLIKGFLTREVDPSLAKIARLLVAGVGYCVLNFLITVVLLPFGPSRFFRPWIRTVQGYGVTIGLLSGRRFLRGKDTAQIHGQ